MLHWKHILLGIAAWLTLAIAQLPALAQSTAQYRSQSGDTVFPGSAVGGCAGDVISYTTQYQGVAYTGVLQVRSPSGIHCEGGRSRVVSGYFEEKNAAVFSGGPERGQWCSGRLTLSLYQGHGDSSAQWSHIQAAPGYDCAGAGTALKLPLIYTP
ncbi:MAG TPA: hypothetical protein V6C57_17280 [Coleofasciculaceae cyanobacterium]